MLFKKSKRTISNIAMLDLRKYTAEGLSKIKAILNTAIIILPSDAPPEFYDAFSKIELKRNASTLKLPTDATISTLNGCSELTGDTVKNGDILICNGTVLFHDLPVDVCPKVIINGTVVIQKGVNIDILQLNGTSVTAEFTEAKLYPNKVEISADYLLMVRDVTIVAGNKIILDDSVTKEMLIERNIRFVAGNKVVCPKAIYGFVTAISTVGNKVDTIENDKD